MIKKTSAVTLIFIISTLLQLVTQVVVTRVYGASLSLDIFLAAVALPTIIVTVIYGTLNDALMPLLGEYKSKNPEELDSYFFSQLISFSILTFVTMGVLCLFALPISTLLYSSRGIEFTYNVSRQMQFMFLSIPVASVATILGTYQYLHKQFIRFPIAQLAGTIFNLFFIILLSSILGIWALVIAFVLNIVAQIFFVLPKTINIKFKWYDMTPLYLLWIPLLVANFSIRSETILIRSIGSELPSGYLVYLNLISKIFSLSTGMITIGIQVLLLPHLIEYLSEKKYDSAIAMVNRSKIGAIFLSVVVTISLVILTPVFINLLFVGGKFSKLDAIATSSLLPFFIIPSIGWGIYNIFFQPLIALKKHLQLAVINIIAVVIAWGAASFIKLTFGVLPAITVGLTVLFFTAIIGSEYIWQQAKKTFSNPK